MAFDPGVSYDDYLRFLHLGGGSDDAGNPVGLGPPSYTKDQWDALNPGQKVQNIGGAWVPDSSDPQYADLYKQTGAEPGRLIITYGDPGQSGWVDPSKNISLGNNLWAIAQNNMTPQAEAQANEMPLAGKIIMGVVGGIMGAGLAGAAGYGSMAADSGASAFSSNAAADAYGAEMGGTTTSAFPTAGAADAYGAEMGGNSAGAGFDSTNLPTTSGAIDTTPASVLNPDLKTPPDVSVPPPDIPGGSNGLISWAQNLGTTIKDGASSLWDKYNNLNPAARMLVGQALKYGSASALQGMAQRNRQDFMQQQRNQQIDEFNRRHQVQAFGNDSFTPKGIINGGGQ